jgi:hypothetical protein
VILGDFFIWSATAFVDSGCAYPKSQVRIEGDNKIYERDADSGFKIRFSFLPDLRQHHFVALAARTGRQQRLLGRRPKPNTYRITVGSFADPNFPAANLLGVGRVDASLARSGDGDRVLPAGSASDPVDAAPCSRRRFSDLP